MRASLKKRMNMTEIILLLETMAICWPGNRFNVRVNDALAFDIWSQNTRLEKIRRDIWVVQWITPIVRGDWLPTIWR